MAEKTDLNISPYYDEYSESKNFHKVLYRAGRPLQARELTTSQSILQNQIEITPSIISIGNPYPNPFNNNVHIPINIPNHENICDIAPCFRPTHIKDMMTQFKPDY